MTLDIVIKSGHILNDTNFLEQAIFDSYIETELLFYLLNLFLLKRMTSLPLLIYWSLYYKNFI